MKRVVAILLAAAAIAVLALNPHAAAPRPNVILITLDTVRADHIGAYGYRLGNTPTLDRLAREGVRFANATTQAPLTGPAHASILTGSYAARFGVRDNATSPLPATVPTIATSLKSAGYQTGGFIGAFILDRSYGFANGFDRFDSEFRTFQSQNKVQAERTAEEVLKPALAWLSSLPEDRPFFAWLHFYDAHAPYSPPSPYREEFKTHPYDGEIAYVDSAIAKLVSALEARGLLDRTLVVAIADHGEGLGDHGEQEHGVFLYDSTLHVPFIMRLPGKAHSGTVVNEQVRVVDLMPTVLDLLHIPVPGRLDGESLVPVVEGRARQVVPASYAETYYPKFHFGWSELKSLRVGEWKFIAAPKSELYDLRRDTSEKTNVIDRQASVAGKISSDLQHVTTALGPVADAQQQASMPDADTIERLRSLGYVGFTGTSGTSTGADPKDMIGQLESFRELIVGATADLQKHQPRLAVTKLKQALRINERAYDVHLLLGDAYLQQHDVRSSVGEYEAAALLNPKNADPLLAAARALTAAGAVDEAKKKIQQAAAIQPDSSDLFMASGRLSERQGLLPQALQEYRLAVERNPSDAQARTSVVNVALRLQQYDVAGEQLQTLLSLGFDPPRVHYALGRVAEGRGDKATAAREYKTALQLDPTLAPARAALAKLK